MIPFSRSQIHPKASAKAAKAAAAAIDRNKDTVAQMAWGTMFSQSIVSKLLDSRELEISGLKDILAQKSALLTRAMNLLHKQLP